MAEIPLNEAKDGPPAIPSARAGPLYEGASETSFLILVWIGASWVLWNFKCWKYVQELGVFSNFVHMEIIVLTYTHLRAGQGFVALT